MAEINLLATLGSVLLTAILTYGVTRVGKGYDARAAAEAALIGTGPTIIAEQNRRISALTEDSGRLWVQIQESYKRERECRDSLTVLQDEFNDQRREIRDLHQKMIALEARLH
jgi:hypothetical protein